MDRPKSAKQYNPASSKGVGGIIKAYLFTKQHNFRPVQIESNCRLHNKCEAKFEICVWKGIKHCGNRRKCWLPAFSPFPSMFLKGFLKVVKSMECVVKG